MRKKSNKVHIKIRHIGHFTLKLKSVFKNVSLNEDPNKSLDIYSYYKEDFKRYTLILASTSLYLLLIKWAFLNTNQPSYFTIILDVLIELLLASCLFVYPFKNRQKVFEFLFQVIRSVLSFIFIILLQLYFYLMYFFVYSEQDITKTIILVVDIMLFIILLNLCIISTQKAIAVIVASFMQDKDLNNKNKLSIVEKLKIVFPFLIQFLTTVQILLTIVQLIFSKLVNQIFL